MSQQQRQIQQQQQHHQVVQQQQTSQNVQQTFTQQQTQQTQQTRVIREVRQGVHQVPGSVQIMPVGLPPGASPPVFDQIFRNARFAQGGDALFEGKVTGNPKPTVSWTRKGQKIFHGPKYQVTHDQNTGIVTFQICAIGPGDEGEYVCTASNEYGEAICTVYIQPEAAYMMQQQRQQQQQQHQQQHQQQQQFQSKQTFMQRTQQQQQTRQFGQVESFRVDTFEYRILHEVEFRQLLTQKLPGEIEVGQTGPLQGIPQAPNVQQKPRSTKVAETNNATFTVKIAANPSPRIIWFKNGERITPSDKYLMSQSAGQVTLVVKNVNANDGGHYTMLAENTSGCTVTSAQLAVVPKGSDVNGLAEPEIIRSEKIETFQMMEESGDESGKSLEPKFVRIPPHQTVQEGKLVRFDCRATGRPYPDVTWLLNGRAISNDANHKILVNEQGNHSLMITQTSLNDAGVITCVARNKSGETSFQVQLNVLEREQVVAPKFVERFHQGQVREGETVQLHARAVGTPTPLLAWQKDGVTIVPSANVQIQSDGGASILQILSASAADAGWYQCTAQNVAGSVSTRARLHVQTSKPGAQSAPQRPHFPRPTKVIEPEKEPEPEIIYLRHIERSHQQMKGPEEEPPTEAPKFTHFLRDIEVAESKRAHFEARVIPLGDATMQIEWLIDGRPLPASSRATVTYRFGYVALDVLNVIDQDAGVYTCRASNVMGQAETSANLRVTEKPVIESGTQHPDALQKISYLEDQHKYQRTESVDEQSNIKPTFVKTLNDLGDIYEGKYAHFEAQIHPVSDPYMRIEWFKDGKPITASSRINVIFNFGYVALTIMHVRQEDTGIYTVRATNKVGECTCQATVRVISLSSVTGDLGIPEQAQYIKSVEEMEAYRLAMQQKTAQELLESTTAPVFKTNLKDASAKEGGYAHFEARLEPIGDPTLKVDWLKDGRPIEASSRITTFFNFGYVALTIKALTPRDAGTYTCRAYNAKGEATNVSSLTVISKTDIESESQYEDTVMKMQYIEDAARRQRAETEESVVKIPPKFLGPLKGTTKIVEGQNAHFEVRLEPQNDPAMKVEWYFNGKILMDATRIKFYNDFGYVALDIKDVRSTDSGTYTVVARNAMGEAQLSATMEVEVRSSIDYSTMHEVTMNKTAAMERRHQEPHYDIEEVTKSKPVFTHPLQDVPPMPEGKNIHLEARLEPMGDPTMKVEWYFNGKPVTVGARFRTYFDFGYVALDIVGAYSTDTGEYTCRAENILGSAHTSSCIQIIGTGDIETDTMHDSAMEQIQYLEGQRGQRALPEDVDVNQPPTFTKSLKNIETIEGTNIHLEARLQPVGDTSMRVEWYFNDKPLKVGHRFRPAYDFDYVALDLLGVYPVDSGIYTCRATNKLGQAVTSASVRVMAKKDLIYDSDHPDALQKLQYLEDSSRYQRRDQLDEVAVKIKPKFLTAIKDQTLKENMTAHFEAKIEPITDANLRVEWYKDGRPLAIGSRFRTIHDFGYVALDIRNLVPEDSGVYTCVATNLLGKDEISASLKCLSSSSIIMESQNESMTAEQLKLLEERRRYERTEVEETTKQAPVFTTSLKNIEILEGQRAHFEARLIPTSDPTMKVEWYCNNKLVKSGSRFTEYNDFGFIALDIMYAYAEDSGTYTCVATNALGQAITSASLVVHTKESIVLDSVNQEAMQQINRLESRSQRVAQVEEATFQAPVFTSPIKDQHLPENMPLHFEARLIPVGDPDLKVEWFRNGVPLQPANRISTMHDFGYVALDMKYVKPEDSGTYTCRATNKLGQAVCSASLTVTSKESLLLETQHAEALEKLRYLEDSSRHAKSATEETVITQAPKFVVQLSGLTQLWEGQSAHVEGRIEPYPDPTMKVEWFHNGNPLSVGHRFRTMYDFGFCALDILSALGTDSGTYEVRATNRLGTASSTININVKPKSDFIIDSQHPEAMAKIQRLEQKEGRKAAEETVVIEKPNFGRALRNQDKLIEGQAVHMEATLTPVNDPTMKVEWFFNGVPIPTGHRFRTTYDFGFVALDILYAYPEDSGTYMCRATNAAGQAVTSCNIKIEATDSMLTNTLDEERMRKIRKLEHVTTITKEEVEKEHGKPVFTTALQSQDQVPEGHRVHLECRLEPVNDPNLKVEWFVNGVEIKTGHRFRTTHDFGYVALDILYAYEEDSGTYLCKATNLKGEAVNSCSVNVSARRSIYMDTQNVAGWEKIQNLEQKSKYERLEVEELPSHPPRFTSELRGVTSLGEGQKAHIEGRIEPIHDPTMRIEWYHNGKVIQSAARFHTTFDFGYVAFDLSSVYPEDSGEYVCRAVNNMGEATSKITLKIEGTGSIIYESARPEGLEKIKELEDASRGPAQATEDLRTFQRPVFTQPLQNLDNLNEGETAHFECRLIPVGDPKLKVEWFRNEKPIEHSSRINRTHDFGYVALDIIGVRPDDEGIYMCRAYNDLGEAVTTASIKIRSHANIQMDTQHAEGLRKIQALEERKPVDRSEPEKVYEKPVFTTQLQGPSQVIEGQSAHYECKVIPVGDPNMKFEWYCNGVSLRMGSRFHTRTDFGFVTLDVLQTIPEDSGVYMCKAYNLAGEAVSSCSTRVIGRDSIIGDAANKQGWEAIRQREAQWNRVPPTPTSPEVAEPPMFTKHLESFDRLQEGGSVTLEAQVQPSGDPYLSIEWFKNGVQLALGTRIRSTFDFGHVVLHISGLRENDSGIYTCKAVNRVGEAVSTCNLKVHDRDWLIGESVRPEALPKLAQLEQPRGVPREESEPVYDLPVFITHLNNVECWEGDTAHFECNVEPSKDPTMKIEWFINGKPLQAASRYSSHYDFGFVTLDCSHCYEEDSGIYMCKATNSKGSASTTGTLKCISKANIFLDTQHPQGKAGLEKVEEAERAFFNKKQRPPTEEEAPFIKPYFIRPLEANFSLMENQTLHMEANVEPKKDPNLKIEWFLNGKPLEHGARYKSSYDFGLVTLDLNDCYERDQGIYTCRAYNKAGEAFCTSTVVVGAKGALIEGTQHPAGDAGLEAIQRMEESLRRSDRMLPDEEGHPPIFTTQFKSLSNIEESEIAHFEAMLTPVGDETMKVEWFYNGETLKASHRVRTVYAFGMVVLEILGTKVADTGEYLCRATNKWGQAECSCTLEVVDRAHGQPPKFTTHIQDIQDAKDGQSGHFECTLIPVGDPNMKVEWFHNGQPLRNATRIKTVCDFGYVVLDVAYLRNHDTGEWICKASNKYGEDYTKAFIKCTGKGGVYYDSLQPGSLDKIAELEANKLGGQSLLSPTGAGEPPKFITQVANIDQLAEGQSAHFEARLKPVGDPNLVVEWYKDGVKLSSKHRYRTFHDFGIVILDILYCYEEDSGVYEARAYNKLGEDKTSATLKCSSKANLILSPQIPKDMEGGLDKIQKMEDTAWMRRQTDISDKAGMPPKFTVPLNDIDGLKEGENAHFEARLVPTDDPRLKVEWYFNGKPMKHSSRVRQFCDFGFVIMEMSTVYAEDSGEYMCRAYNDYGEAVTKGILKCEGKRSIIFDSQLPKSMQGGMQKIAELEGLMIKTPDDLTSPDSGQPPQFLTQPADVNISENQLAHFECRLIPVGDPALRVEWYHNGRSLRTGTRIKTINDFGYVILELANCYSRDAGTYTCRAVNKHGEASVECKLNVSTKSGIILDPQATGRFKGCTESILKLEEQRFKKGDDASTEDEKPNPPRFITNLENIVDLGEGQPAHFDCRVEPVGDPTMRIEWFHNGSQLGVGSRVHMMDDFGFVVLDLEWTFARDSGEYVCRATNKWGQATTSATLKIKSKHGVDMNTQLPQGMTAEKLKELERGPLLEKPDVDEQAMPPKFIVPLKDIAIEEGELARFEADVEPKTDPNLRIEWYFNGKPLQSGHRFRTSFEMGHVILELLYTYPEDSGEYICRAVNRVGQDATKASLKSKAAQCVIMQSQALKGVKPKDLMTQMEETMRKYNVKEVLITEEDIYDVKKRQPPRFITQIQENTSLVELHDYKFDCQLTPVGDPNMKVEWFFNGRPLPYKTRFTPIYDFGYVALIMSWLYGEDSGEYLCRATNKYGMDETKAFIKIAGRPGVIYDSQIPKGMNSLEKIRDLESSWKITPNTEVEEEKVRSKPEILKAPETILVQEGSWARFSMRVAGYPKPRVMWIVNGSTAVSGNRFKIWYDGMFHLDIPKTRQYDEGKIEVIARNSLGEAYATCELKVKPRQDDYRAVLKNSPKPWYDYDLKSYQHDRMDSELERVFEERVDPENAILHKSKFGEYMAKPVNYQEETEWQRLAREKNAGDKIKALEDEQRLRGRGKESHMFAQPATLAQQHSLAKGMASRYEENLAEDKRGEEAAPSPKLLRRGRAPETNIEQVNQSREAQLKRQQQRQEQLAQQRMIAEEQKRQEMIRKQQEQQEFLKQQTDQEVRTQKLRETEPSESSVHGKEVHTSVQKQQQKEIQGDVEIHRKITTTEKTEMEHKGKTTERVVQGPVEPANPPFFTKKIQPCRAFEKEGARFEVEFDGEPRPTVQWYREDFPITSSPDFQIHTFGDKSILLIREVFMEDSGVFAVVAENRVGRAKCSANLVVEERKQSRSGVVPPSFTSTIQDVRMKVGSLVRLDAKIHGTQPIDVYWLKGGQKIQEDSRRKMVVEEGVNTLLILEAVIDDTGSYECVAINKAGEARCQADVVITGDSTPASTPTAPKGTKQAPTIIEKLKGHIVQEGQSARFECVVSGEPTPTVQWLKGNQVIKPSKYFTMSADEGRYVLNITEAFPEDEGTYRCILKNSVGKVELEAPLKVTQPQQVEVPPTLTQMKGITVQEGENITFSTTVSGKPLPKIQWYREGTLIPSTPEFEMALKGNTATLTITETYPEDTGTFTCRATNPAGQAETSALLTVQSEFVETEDSVRLSRGRKVSLTRKYRWVSPSPCRFSDDESQRVYHPWRPDKKKVKKQKFKRIPWVPMKAEKVNYEHVASLLRRDSRPIEPVKTMPAPSIPKVELKKATPKQFVKEPVQLETVGLRKSVPNQFVKEEFKLEEVTLHHVERDDDIEDKMDVDESRTGTFVETEDRSRLSRKSVHESKHERKDKKQEFVETQDTSILSTKTEEDQALDWRKKRVKPLHKPKEPFTNGHVEEVVPKKPKKSPLAKKLRAKAFDKYRSLDKKQDLESDGEDILSDSPSPQEEEGKEIISDIYDSSFLDVGKKEASRRPKKLTPRDAEEKTPIEEQYKNIRGELKKTVWQKDTPSKQKLEQVQLKPTKREERPEEDTKQEEVHLKHFERLEKQKPFEKKQVEEQYPGESSSEFSDESEVETATKEIQTDEPYSDITSEKLTDVQEESFVKPEASTKQEPSVVIPERKLKSESPGPKWRKKMLPDTKVEPEEVHLKPVKRKGKEPEVEKDQVTLKPVKKKLKEQELKDEPSLESLKPVDKDLKTKPDKPQQEGILMPDKSREKVTDSEDTSALKLSSKILETKEKDEPSTTEYSPDEKSQVEETEELKPVTKKKDKFEPAVVPEEIQKPKWKIKKLPPKQEPEKEEVVLKPLKRKEKEQEPDKEAVTLTPLKKKPREELPEEGIDLTQVGQKEKIPKIEEDENLKSAKRKEKESGSESDESVKLKPFKKVKDEKPQEEEPMPTWRKKPVLRPKEEEDELALKAIPKITDEIHSPQTELDIKPEKSEKKPEEKERTPLWRRKPLPKDKEEKEDIQLKPIKPDDEKLEAPSDTPTVAPVKKLEKEEPKEEAPTPKWRRKIIPQKEPDREEVTLKPVKRKEKEPEPEKDVITLKPVKKKPREEEPEEDTNLKPIKRLEKEPEPKEEVELKPFKIEKEKQPEEGDTVLMKPIKPVEKEPEPEEPVKLKPFKKEKEEPSKEDVQLKPIKRIEKEPESEEPIKLKPFKKEKEEPPKEDVQLKQIKRIEKEPEPEEPIKLKPFKKEKEVPPKEDVQLKPIKRIEKEIEPDEEIKLKPFKKIKDEKPEDEESTPKWRRKPISPPEEEKEDVTLKPIPKTVAKPEKESELIDIDLKPTKPVKPVEKPEDDEQKPSWRRKPLPKDKEEKEDVQLKPIKPDDEKPEEHKEAPSLAPVKKLDKEPEEEASLPKWRRKIIPEKEPEREEVTLKPVKRKEKEPEPEKDVVSLKPVKKKPREEEPEEDTHLKPIKRLEKEPEPKEEIALKPFKKEQEEEPEEEGMVPVKPIKRIEKEAEPEEPIKLKPFKKDKEEKPEDDVHLKPIKRIEKEPQPAEPIELKPFKKEKEEPPKEDVQLKPIKRVEKEPEPEESIKLKPFKKEKEEPPKEDVQLKPIKRIEKEPEPEEPIKLKPSKKEKEEPPKEEISLKPFKRRPKPEPEPKEEVKLKPVKKSKEPVDEKDEPEEEIPLRRHKKIPEITEQKPLKPFEEQMDEEQIKELPYVPYKKSKVKPSEIETELEDYVLISQVETRERKPKPSKKKSVSDILEIIETKRIEEETQVKPVEKKVKKKTLKRVDKKPKEIDVIPPKFTVPLKPVIQHAQEQVEFVCEVTAYPLPEITWFFNSERIVESETITTSFEKNVAKLTIRDVQEPNVGLYSCEAKNSAGKTTSTSNLVIEGRQEEVPRGEHPLFYEVLHPANVKHGEPAVFRAKVRGHPPPKILWYHGEKELPVSEDFVQEFHTSTGTVQLTIKEVFIDDKGLYKAVAINEHGRDETTGYLSVEDLEVLEKSDLRQAPRIIVPLEAQVLPVGSPVVLRAKFEAFPPPTVKWYKEMKEIKPSPEFIVENTEEETTLQITELYEDDYGEYQVRVFNEAGEARSAASVIVIYPQQKPEVQDLIPPKFVKSLKPQIVPEGEVAILEAEVTAKPEAEFTWYRHGEQLQTDDDLEVQVNTSNNKSTLVINELFEDDSGDYTVTATNVVGKTSSTATLLVEGETTEETIPPEFCPPLTPLRVMDGEQVRFTCKLKGKPTPRISWYHNGRPIDHHREVKVMQTPDGRVGLLISEVFPEDAGDYTCIARNKAGEARCTTSLNVESYEYHPDSEAATMASVSDKQILSGTASEDEILDIEKDSESDSEAGTSPFFSNKLETLVETNEGSPIRLVAKAEGYPKPDIIWYADEKPIESSEEINLENFEDGTVALNIPYTVVDHCGIYTCEAMNRNGVDTTATQLIVLPQEHTEGANEQYRKPDWVKKMEILKHKMEEEKTAPEFIQELVPGRVKEMETHTFTTTFTGNPKPEITWLHNERILHQSQTYQMRVRGDKAILTVVQVSPEQKGEYTCKAVNSVGEATTKSTLEIIELTYEEKLKIDNERYAALQIQHAAEHMRLKEVERREKLNLEQKIALFKLKEERKQRSLEKQRELEDAKSNVWKTQVKQRVEKVEKVDKVEEPKQPLKSVQKKPKEYRIEQVYSGWKKPENIEETYPELEPVEFAPNQVPGVKCFVKVSETSMKGDEVVKEIAPQFFEDEEVLAEIAKVHSLLKKNVSVNEIWSMFRAGEFKHLQQPKIQTALVKICEYIGHQRNVSMVLAEETQEQAKVHPVGLKALLRMVKYAKDIKPEVFFKEVIPREMGRFSSTTQELQQVSQMIKQGIENEEIIATCEAGKLPTLKRPETQQPLINIVEKQGHTVMVAQVLVEEAYKDAKEERAMAERAWQIVHEEELVEAKVHEVEPEPSYLPERQTTQETVHQVFTETTKELKTVPAAQTSITVTEIQKTDLEQLPEQLTPLDIKQTEQRTIKIHETVDKSTLDTYDEIEEGKPEGKKPQGPVIKEKDITDETVSQEIIEKKPKKLKPKREAEVTQIETIEKVITEETLTEEKPKKERKPRWSKPETVESKVEEFISEEIVVTDEKPKKEEPLKEEKPKEEHVKPEEEIRETVIEEIEEKPEKAKPKKEKKPRWSKPEKIETKVEEIITEEVVKMKEKPEKEEPVKEEKPVHLEESKPKKEEVFDIETIVKEEYIKPEDEIRETVTEIIVEEKTKEEKPKKERKPRWAKPEKVETKLEELVTEEFPVEEEKPVQAVEKKPKKKEETVVETVVKEEYTTPEEKIRETIIEDVVEEKPEEKPKKRKKTKVG